MTDGSHRWVLRTPPRTGRTPSAHDVAREYRVTSALSSTDVPVPPAVALCENESLIGGPFALGEFVEGRTLQHQVDLAPLGTGTATEVSLRLVETLAALHRLDHVGLGLESFGRPDGYAERQLRRWAGQWELVGTPALEPAASGLVARLRAELPEQHATGVVHGISASTTRSSTSRPPQGREWRQSSTGNSRRLETRPPTWR